MRHRAGFTFALFLICGRALAADAAAPTTGVADDTAATTTAGAAFTIPKSWSKHSTGTMALLSPPEPDLHIAIVEVGEAGDAKAAAGRAWATYRPDAGRTIGLATAQPAGDGWEEKQVFSYQTSPNEHAIVQALALRRGAAWTVIIVDGNQATFEKRAAAAVLVMQSLRPAGFQRESFVGRKANPLNPARVEALKTFVQTSMKELGIPGASIALIEHGKVIFEGGFGVRTLGQPTPVDAHTTFMIASNTKSLTTLLISKLIDEGKLSWDEPAVTAYPDFRLGSDTTTQKVLIRHLVCACTGLPRTDLVWALKNGRDTPAASTFNLLAGHEPTSGFGEVFQYNNLMAAAAGYIAAHTVHPDRELGAAYDATLQEKILGPLGMAETTLSFPAALKGNHASPHGFAIDGAVTPVNLDFEYTTVHSRPAGGAWSSAHDLIKYVRLELANGKLPNGQALVSPKNLLARRESSVPVGEDGFYGKGLFGARVGGLTDFEHGGSMPGFMSNFYVLPDADVGAVILTNSDSGGQLLRPFRRRLFELLYDGKPEAAAAVTAAAAAQLAVMAKLRGDVTVPPAPEAAADLASSYFSPEIGSKLVVRKEGAERSFFFGEFAARVASKHNPDGSTSFIMIEPGITGIEFVASKRDGKRALVVREGQHEYLYSETP